MIVAMADDGAIGAKGGLPWHLPEDLKFFKATTKGYPVIMGRTTYLSLPFRPLKERLNIVLTRGDAIDRVVTVSSLSEAFEKAMASGAEKCFIIGGASIYKQSLTEVDTLYVTRVHTRVPDADAFFPAIDMENWSLFSSSETSTDEKTGLKYEFLMYKRKK